jgi:hypothetical protein
MGATLATLSNIMKNFYLGPVQLQFNNEILVHQLLNLDSENLEGLAAKIPLHSKRSGGIGSRGELETLPAAGNQGYDQASYDLAYHYGFAQVSGQSIHKTRSSAGAFLQAMKGELDGLKDDLALDFARQVYGNGDGIIAQTAANAGVNVVVLQSEEAIVKGFLYINMLVDIGDLSNPIVVAQARTITDIDPVAKTITISGAVVTTTTSHRVFRSGNAGPSTTYALREMDAGLQKLVSTSAGLTVGGINSGGAGSKFWDNLRNTTGGAISLSTLMSEFNRSDANGAKPGQVKGITTPGLTRRLFETSDFKSLIQFVNTKEFAGGFSEISFAVNGSAIKLYPDRHAPWGQVLLLDTQRVRLFAPMDWDFLSRDGLTIRWVDSIDAYKAGLFRYANMGTNRRNTSNVVGGLTDTGV